jgi:transmembrane sensor
VSKSDTPTPMPMPVPAPDVGQLQQASEWVQRLNESGGQEAADQWLQWCESDPQNLAAFEQMQRLWDGFSVVQERRLHPPATANRFKRSGRAILLAASILLGAASFVWFISRPEIRVLDTSVGQLRQVRLSDGSQIDLAPDSHIRTRFTSTLRDVQLERGQAFFAVAHSASRPFVVHVANLTVTTLGTAFDVRTGPNSTVVMVSEGRVSVSPGVPVAAGDAGPESETVRAGVGQRVTFNNSARRFSVASSDPSGAGSWRSGTLQFVGEPLEDVVSAVNRYISPHVVVSSAFRQTRFTGTLSPPNVDEWLKALEQIYDVKVVDQGSNGILIRARIDDSGKK